MNSIPKWILNTKSINESPSEFYRKNYKWILKSPFHNQSQLLNENQLRFQSPFENQLPNESQNESPNESPLSNESHLQLTKLTKSKNHHHKIKWIPETVENYKIQWITIRITKWISRKARLPKCWKMCRPSQTTPNNWAFSGQLNIWRDKPLNTCK